MKKMSRICRGLLAPGSLAALVLLMFASAPGQAADLDGQGAVPRRSALIELYQFSLCECDLKTLARKGPCIPANVPGDVFTALMQAGRIDDPYQDLNSQAAQWVDERAWVYEISFEYAKIPGKRAHLLFMGLDYIARIELNGKVLAPRHEGMFSRVDLDITDALGTTGKQDRNLFFC